MALREFTGGNLLDVKLWNSMLNWTGLAVPTADDVVVISRTSTNDAPIVVNTTSTNTNGVAGQLFIVNGNSVSVAANRSLTVVGESAIGGSADGGGTNTFSALTVNAGASYVQSSGPLGVGSGSGGGGILANGGSITTLLGNIVLGTSGSSALANVRNNGTISAGGEISVGSATELAIGGFATDAAEVGGTVSATNGIRLDGGFLTFNLIGTNTMATRVTGSGSVLVKEGQVTLSSATNNYSGSTTVEAGGTLRAGADGAFSANSLYSVLSGGTLNLNGFDQTIRTLTGAGSVTSSAAADLTISATAIHTFSGVISGALTLRKGGAPTTILTNANTYTGATIISDGALQLQGNGSISASSSVTVLTGASFQIGGISGSSTSIKDLTLNNGSLDLGGKKLIVTEARLNAGSGTVTGSFGADSIEFRVISTSFSLTGLSFNTNFWNDAVDTIIIEGMANASDSIIGSSRADLIRGGAGAANDTLAGGAGNDTLDGGAGADRLDGGANFDYASYASATSGLRADIAFAQFNTGDALGDTYIGIEGVQGSGFADVLLGDAAANTVFGNNGADTIVGRGGADSLYGGEGRDVLEGGAGADLHDGGAEFDYVSYAGSTAGVRADMLSPQTGTGDGAGDTFVSIDGIQGSNFDDIISGTNTGSDWLFGFAGADVFFSRSGTDYMFGGTGNDIFYFAKGYGLDTIGDFIAGAASGDLIQLQTTGVNGVGTAFDTFAEIFAAAVQQGADTVITFDGSNRLTLSGVTKANLTAGDFMIL